MTQEEISTDPVCGMVKPKSQFKFSSVVMGKHYYFDTQNDKGLFDAHPDYYLPKEERERYRRSHGK